MAEWTARARRRLGGAGSKLASFLLGDDVFVSYARRDADEFALNLAIRLTEEKLSCCLDQWGTPPGLEALPAPLRRSLRRSNMLVVLGSKASLGSKYVKMEVEEFDRFQRTGRPVIFVAFVESAEEGAAAAALEGAAWHGLIEGRKVRGESLRNLAEGTPSDKLVELIVHAEGFRSRRSRLRRVFAATVFALLGLLAWAGYLAFDVAEKQAQIKEQEEALETAKGNVETLEARESALGTEIEALQAEKRKVEERVAQAETAARNRLRSLETEALMRASSASSGLRALELSLLAVPLVGHDDELGDRLRRQIDGLANSGLVARYGPVGGLHLPCQGSVLVRVDGTPRLKTATRFLVAWDHTQLDGDRRVPERVSCVGKDLSDRHPEIPELAVIEYEGGVWEVRETKSAGVLARASGDVKVGDQGVTGGFPWVVLRLPLATVLRRIDDPPVELEWPASARVAYGGGDYFAVWHQGRDRPGELRRLADGEMVDELPPGEVKIAWSADRTLFALDFGATAELRSAGDGRRLELDGAAAAIGFTAEGGYYGVNFSDGTSEVRAVTGEGRGRRVGGGHGPVELVPGAPWYLRHETESSVAFWFEGSWRRDLGWRIDQVHLEGGLVVFADANGADELRRIDDLEVVDRSRYLLLGYGGGHYVAIADSGAAELRRPEDGPICSLPAGGPVSASPDGRFFAWRPRDGADLLIRVADCRMTELNGRAKRLTFGPHSYFEADYESHSEIRSALTGHVLSSVGASGSAEGPPPRSWRFSASRSYLVHQGNGLSLTRLDPDGPVFLETLDTSVVDWAFDEPRGLLYTLGSDGRVDIHDLDLMENRGGEVVARACRAFSKTVNMTLAALYSPALSVPSVCRDAGP